MSDAVLATSVGAIATLAGVGLGSWLTAFLERRSGKERRRWEIMDRSREERRTVFLRFLNAADAAVHQAWETGRKRTTVHTSAEGKQHYLDWVAVRDRLGQVLTEMRLVGPANVYKEASRVLACAVQFGESSLLAGVGKGMDRPPADHQREYDARVADLLAAMQQELGSVDSRDQRPSGLG